MTDTSIFIAGRRYRLCAMPTPTYIRTVYELGVQYQTLFDALGPATPVWIIRQMVWNAIGDSTEVFDGDAWRKIVKADVAPLSADDVALLGEWIAEQMWFETEHAAGAATVELQAHRAQGGTLS